MVCRLMPAARATSASVIADQSRLPSSSRIASSTESRRRARDASAYGTLRICATLTPLAPLLCIAALDMVALFDTAPLLLITSLCIVAGGWYHEWATSTISKSDFAAPQSGQLQSSGMSSHRVPGAMPSSGHPLASSYSKPHCTQTNSLYSLISLPPEFRSRAFHVRRSPGSGRRPSGRGSVAGQHLLAQARLHIDAGDVAAVVRQHPVIHQPAPQRREVGQPDQRRVTARQVRRPVHAAQRLVAPSRVGVMITVPLQVIQEQVGDDVVGVPAVLRRAALVPAVVVLVP